MAGTEKGFEKILRNGPGKCFKTRGLMNELVATDVETQVSDTVLRRSAQGDNWTAETAGPDEASCLHSVHERHLNVCKDNVKSEPAVGGHAHDFDRFGPMDGSGDVSTHAAESHAD